MKTIFLQGKLEERIPMSKPEGFKDKDKKVWVCLLQRSLYGLNSHLNSGTRGLIISFLS